MLLCVFQYFNDCLLGQDHFFVDTFLATADVHKIAYCSLCRSCQHHHESLLYGFFGQDFELSSRGNLVLICLCLRLTPLISFFPRLSFLYHFIRSIAQPLIFVCSAGKHVSIFKSLPCVRHASLLLTFVRYHPSGLPLQSQGPKALVACLPAQFFREEVHRYNLKARPCAIIPLTGAWNLCAASFTLSTFPLATTV